MFFDTPLLLDTSHQHGVLPVTTDFPIDTTATKNSTISASATVIVYVGGYPGGEPPPR